MEYGAGAMTNDSEIEPAVEASCCLVNTSVVFDGFSLGEERDEGLGFLVPSSIGVGAKSSHRVGLRDGKPFEWGVFVFLSIRGDCRSWVDKRGGGVCGGKGVQDKDIIAYFGVPFFREEIGWALRAYT